MSEPTQFVIQGDAELAAKLKVKAEYMTAELAREMMLIAGEIERRASHLVPWDTGELASRSFTEMVHDESDDTYMAVVGYEKHGENYGKVNKDAAGKFYAAPVHERMDVNHNKPNRKGGFNGRQAKFLEIPFKQMEPEYLQLLANAAKKGAEK